MTKMTGGLWSMEFDLEEPFQHSRLKIRVPLKGSIECIFWMVWSFSVFFYRTFLY